MTSIKKIIEILNLREHPEGGFYRESYKSPYSTCIYFLLTSKEFSAFHRLRNDEIWHFYEGSSTRLHFISKEGKHDIHIIGNDIKNGERPQVVVPGGTWFSAEVISQESHSLVGCTMSPGFSFKDFEIKGKGDLITLFPNNKDIIRRLTRAS